jgi:hypothetical protein
MSKAYKRMLGDFGDIFWECKEQEQSRSVEGSMKVNSSEKNTRKESQKESGSKQSKNKDSASYKKK